MVVDLMQKELDQHDIGTVVGASGPDCIVDVIEGHLFGCHESFPLDSLAWFVRIDSHRSCSALGKMIERQCCGSISGFPVPWFRLFQSARTRLTSPRSRVPQPVRLDVSTCRRLYNATARRPPAS